MTLERGRAPILAPALRPDTTCGCSVRPARQLECAAAAAVYSLQSTVCSHSALATSATRAPQSARMGKSSPLLFAIICPLSVLHCVTLIAHCLRAACVRAAGLLRVGPQRTPTSFPERQVVSGPLQLGIHFTLGAQLGRQMDPRLWPPNGQRTATGQAPSRRTFWKAERRQQLSAEGCRFTHWRRD